MAVGQRALDGEDGLVFWNDGAALEQGLEACDEFGRPVGEIEERAFFDLASDRESSGKGNVCS
jgi:hypothetical protein